MPSGIIPKVNVAHEFLEIAKDFRDSKEIIREALSNSWDANATEIAFNFIPALIPGTRARRIDVSIIDNGDGMDGTSISDFFDLGESHKPQGTIGTKGHGTKIYYKSQGIKVDTWHDGVRIHAETEQAPWPSLNNGHVPTYGWKEVGNDGGKGTEIMITGFEAKQSDFKDFTEIQRYIYWYTIAGSFASYFGPSRSIKIRLKTLDSVAPATIDFGFAFPKENLDITKGTTQYCKVFKSETIDCGYTAGGKKVELQVVAAILGDAHRSIVPETYTYMGIWLCKDFVKVERLNDIIEKVTGGQYYYRPFLVFANCQQLDLTANRQNFRRDDEEFELAYDGLTKYFNKVWQDPSTKEYQKASKEEEEKKKEKEEAKVKEQSEKQHAQTLAERIKAYNSKISLTADGLVGPPIKEPSNEAETILLLQSMISSKIPDIDFRIGEYHAYSGEDFIIEFVDKGIPRKAWAEVVYTLDKLFQWPHQLSSIDKIICWRRENVPSEVKLTKVKQGIYKMEYNANSIQVYVLSEILST